MSQVGKGGQAEWGGRVGQRVVKVRDWWCGLRALLRGWEGKGLRVVVACSAEGIFWGNSSYCLHCCPICCYSAQREKRLKVLHPCFLAACSVALLLRGNGLLLWCCCGYSVSTNITLENHKITRKSYHSKTWTCVTTPWVMPFILPSFLIRAKNYLNIILGMHTNPLQ